MNSQSEENKVLRKYASIMRPCLKILCSLHVYVLYLQLFSFMRWVPIRNAQCCWWTRQSFLWYSHWHWICWCRMVGNIECWCWNPASYNAQILFPTPINYSASLRALPQLGGAVGASGCVPPRGINLEAAGFLEGWMMVGIWFCINPLKLFYIFGECWFRGSKSFEDSEGET